MSALLEIPTVDDLVKKIVTLTSEPAGDVIQFALSERLARLESEDVAERWKAINKIQDRVAAMPILDTRSVDEILGYNEFGHFD